MFVFNAKKVTSLKVDSASNLLAQIQTAHHKMTKDFASHAENSMNLWMELVFQLAKIQTVNKEPANVAQEDVCNAKRAISWTIMEFVRPSGITASNTANSTEAVLHVRPHLSWSRANAFQKTNQAWTLIVSNRIQTETAPHVEDTTSCKMVNAFQRARIQNAACGAQTRKHVYAAITQTDFTWTITTFACQKAWTVIRSIHKQENAQNATAIINWKKENAFQQNDR